MNANGVLIIDLVSNFWEAWEVDSNGAVYPGYIKDYQGPKPPPIKGSMDQFVQNIPGPKSSGFCTVIGYARYIEGFKVTWPAGGILAETTLPATTVMPTGWSDDNTVKHGYTIGWNDFTGQAPKIIQEWP
jgi:hypothetical protein